MTISFPVCVRPRPARIAFSDVPNHPGPARDEAIWAELELGNIPMFLRAPVVLALESKEHFGAIDVLPDYLAIGTDDDFVRVPMTPGLAQRVCDAWDAQLPTKRLVDAIWSSAAIRLPPQPWGPPYDKSMLTTERFIAHNARIEQARKLALHVHPNVGALVAGHKKDVVVTPELAFFPRHVAIYGWHDRNGKPIQSLNPRRGGPTNTHEDTYADYSHGIRLIARHMNADGDAMLFADVLASPELSSLVSDEGPSKVARY